jgi:hypothetical protein
MIRIFTAISIASVSFAASAALPKPVEAFYQETNGTIMLCQISEKTALNKAQLSGAPDGLSQAVAEIGKCIREGKATVKAKWPAALALVSKKPTAAKLMKDYYASWISAMDGVMPGLSEPAGRYSQRQESMQAKYEEIWNRFEIESGY